MRRQTELNTRVMKAFLWSGPLLMVTMGVVCIPMMNFIPPPSPDLTAKELADEFVDRKDAIRIGAIILCIGFTFWVTWGAALTIAMRRMERGYPVLTVASIIIFGGGWVFFILMPLTWAVIAFRPEALDPNVVQIMNDWVWFTALFSWPPFSLWMLLLAVAIFHDHNEPTIYPRWVAYFNCWCALLEFPAGLIALFKTGPFAYDGLLSFWLPAFVFFIWMTVMTVMTFRFLNDEERRLAARREAAGRPGELAAA